MSTHVKLLLLIVISLMIAAPLAIAQEETPSVIEQFAMTATAIIEARTTTPTPAPEEPTLEPTQAATEEAAVTDEPTEEATPEVTEEPTEEATPLSEVTPTEEVIGQPTETPEIADEAGDAAEVRGVPLGVLLVGALAVLIIGTVVFLRENPRPLDEDEE